ncbi:hypothetical protein [Thalassiella azotivora]
MTEARVVHDAVEATLGTGFGRFLQFARTPDGSVAAVTDGLFDVRGRRVAMRQRFLVDDEDDDLMTDWVASVAIDDLFHLERPGETKWSTVILPWPSSSPLFVLHWLLGTIAVGPSRPTHALPGAVVHTVELSAVAAIRSTAPVDVAGVRASLDEAQLPEDALVSADVTVTGSGVIHAISLPLPGADGGLALDVEFSHLGLPVSIEPPDAGKPMDITALVNDLVTGTPGDGGLAGEP